MARRQSYRGAPIPTDHNTTRGARWRAAAAATAFAASALVATGAAIALTWLRLFRGMDLRDESFYVLVPWRWALGDKPFLQEQNLAGIPGFVLSPSRSCSP